MEETKEKIDIWSVFIYLILYSVAGFVIETVFGAFTKGVIESRKSFLYGPFCAIYGVRCNCYDIAFEEPKKVVEIIHRWGYHWGNCRV